MDIFDLFYTYDLFQGFYLEAAKEMLAILG